MNGASDRGWGNVGDGAAGRDADVAVDGENSPERFDNFDIRENNKFVGWSAKLERVGAGAFDEVIDVYWLCSRSRKDGAELGG